MIKRVTLVRLRGDRPREQCLDHWFGEHADLVRGLPGIVEYTVDVAAEPRPAGSWDAIATLRFADAAALDRFQGDAELQEQLGATREDFAEAVDVLLVDEHPLITRGGTQ